MMQLQEVIGSDLDTYDMVGTSTCILAKYLFRVHGFVYLSPGLMVGGNLEQLKSSMCVYLHGKQRMLQCMKFTGRPLAGQRDITHDTT